MLTALLGLAFALDVQQHDMLREHLQPQITCIYAVDNDGSLLWQHRHFDVWINATYQWVV